MSKSGSVITGCALAAIASAAVHAPLSAYAAPLLALFLALTACVYLGALLAQRQTRGVAAAEIAVSSIVFSCAVMGTIAAAYWLAVGYALHGAWDWAHDRKLIATKVASWFPPACAAFDFVIAAFILLLVA
ncbi:MAG: hypothetical protein KJO38_10105 [Gammaproteobacteria bacterium]|nr:hypothetical protein [Gammaproteobacteria bacterium]